MDEQVNFSKTSLPENEEIYSNLNMEDITDAGYMHAKKVFKDFEIKDLGEYHDFISQKWYIFLADLFEIFRKMCSDIDLLDPAKFILAPGLVWQKNSHTYE